MSDGRHVTTNVLPSIIYARIEQGKKRSLYQFACSQIHQLGIFARDPELNGIELVQVLEESACVRKYLTRRLPLEPVMPLVEKRTGDIRSRPRTCEH